jgi:hypothetical protein
MDLVRVHRLDVAGTFFSVVRGDCTEELEDVQALS